MGRWRWLVCAALVLLGIGSTLARAEESWQVRFEALTVRSAEVMSLPPAELQALLSECEILRSRLEELPESPRKVFRKRLELSCNLLRFALEQKSPPAP